MPPMYTFEITSGDDSQTDRVECSSVEDMRARALRMAIDSISNLGSDFWKQPLWALRVTDESNISILMLKLEGDPAGTL